MIDLEKKAAEYVGCSKERLILLLQEVYLCGIVRAEAEVTRLRASLCEALGAWDRLDTYVDTYGRDRIRIDSLSELCGPRPNEAPLDPRLEALTPFIEVMTPEQKARFAEAGGIRCSGASPPLLLDLVAKFRSRAEKAMATASKDNCEEWHAQQNKTRSAAWTVAADELEGRLHALRRESETDPSALTLQDRYDHNTALLHARTKAMNEAHERIYSLEAELEALRKVAEAAEKAISEGPGHSECTAPLEALDAALKEWVERKRH